MKTTTKLLIAVLAAAAALPVAGLAYQFVATELDRRRFRPPGKLIEAESGQRVHVHCVGDRSRGPTVVIEVGAGNWSLHWRSVQDRLSRRWRVCAYDRPRFGWSDVGPSPAVAIGDRTGLLNAALEKAGEPAPFILVGHSYGGYLARLFRDRYPHKVVAIALVEAAHESQWREMPALRTMVMEWAPKTLRQAELMARFGLLRVMAVAASDPLADPDHRRIADAAARTPRFYASYRAEIEGTEAVADAVARTHPLGTLPLLVVSAGRSVTPYCGNHVGLPCEPTQRAWDGLQAALAGLSSNSKHVVVPAATHAIQIDGEAELVRALDEFFAEIRDGRVLPAVSRSLLERED